MSNGFYKIVSMIYGYPVDSSILGLRAGKSCDIEQLVCLGGVKPDRPSHPKNRIMVKGDRTSP